MTINSSPEAEENVRAAVLWWLSAFITVSLVPISPEAIRSLDYALVVGGLAALTIWAVRYAEPGDLAVPSRAWTAAYTLLLSLITGALAVAWTQEIGNDTAAGLPHLIGLFTATAVLTPVVGLWAAPVSVAAAVGSLAALAAGWLVGEREALALLSFAFAGAALGTAFAYVLRRARELAVPEREAARAGGEE